MKILITGSSGYLGGFLLAKFRDQNVSTLGRSNSDFNLDLVNEIPSLPLFDCIVHAAGKAHVVPQSPKDTQVFWDVNVLGTRNLLKALEASPPKRFVFISTVAVYGMSKGVLLNETAPLLAKDPYGQSKIHAEAEILSWCNSMGVKCTILRLPLVFGENPPGNLKAMIRGIQNGYYFNIAGGIARKSMVRANDVALFILPASEVGGIFHLTDGHHPNFYELSHFIGKSMGRNWIPNMPIKLAYFAAKVGDLIGDWFPLNSHKIKKITSELTFDDSKARVQFGWEPTPVIF